ncbi:hypothetical protein GCK72_024740 [Caenorhabditis remanei]|uniref:Ground-like domain-containing protein n=1 Tax=Caenorhabditis remanei TaxID=31234 RepID=A0A6A5G0E5_CAERE|nr:hypothetical protein GCK72_024740 [Caenorhabditis remanei]KAF1748273.1 hypothetical protein GCK72_024740 [Caenorhabditis remanei]
MKEISNIEDNVGIVLLNQHAMNITLNWLCNLKAFHDPTILENIVVFAMDNHSYQMLSMLWPSIRTFKLELPSVSQPFRVGHCQYQLFQLLRANLATMLSMMNKSFWMLQPDTYWRENLFDLFDVSGNDATDVYLDVEGESVLSSRMIAGGNFHVRASTASTLFFHQLSTQIRERYTTDNNVMGALCAQGFASVKCEFIPYHTISNWRWKNKNLKPALMQFDSLILPGTMGKLERMHRAGAKFVHPDGSCLVLESANVSSLVTFDETLPHVLFPPCFHFFHVAHVDMMPNFVSILLLTSIQLAFAAEEYKSQTTYPESAPATTPQPPPPPPPPKPAPYVEQSAAPPPPAPAPAPYPQQAPPPPAPYPQQAVPAPAPAPYPQQAPPPPTPAPYPQHAVPAPAPYQQQPPPPPSPVHYPAPQQPYPQQAPPPPPAPHPAPHPAYIEHSAPRPAYPEHAPPPQYPQQHSYNGGPRTYHEEPPPYPAKFQYVDYPATTRRPYPYPSFEVLPHHEEYHPTRRPTTTERPTTTHKPRPGWGDTEYNYPERSLPLKGCFYNNHGYACCNLRLQNKMEELADELLNNGTFHRCNVQKLANDLQDKVETAFKEDFETVVGLSDFAERIHFREHYVCKIEVNGRYMLAWATPDDHSGARAKRGVNATADDIHEYNF